jgi:hypothetical protein
MDWKTAFWVLLAVGFVAMVGTSLWANWRALRLHAKVDKLFDEVIADYRSGFRCESAGEQGANDGGGQGCDGRDDGRRHLPAVLLAKMRLLRLI